MDSVILIVKHGIHVHDVLSHFVWASRACSKKEVPAGWVCFCFSLIFIGPELELISVTAGKL